MNKSCIIQTEYNCHPKTNRRPKFSNCTMMPSFQQELQKTWQAMIFIALNKLQYHQVGRGKSIQASTSAIPKDGMDK
eukprot:6901916-Ditylum_brightwellii.AAC.1